VYSRNASARHAGFTLVELLTAAAVFAFFAAALLGAWTALGTSSLNTIAYCHNQNDQMRCFDYLKRDIRRATTVAIYNGGALVTGANNWGSTLQLTIPKYYTDSRQEDDAVGGRTASTPTLTSGVVTYGTPMTVQYYISNGVIIHSEGGVTRTVSDGGSIDTLSFCVDSTGLIRCRVSYTQTMRSGANRTLQRQVDILCGQHTTL
jgi:prepilin-type N-terminal cleavage/methylation domain-containing protein